METALLRKESGMNKILQETSLKSADFNPFSLIAEDWMLVTAGPLDKWNTMTASWGGFGYLWNRDVAFVFVRQARHTFRFMESNDRFTLSFFPSGYKQALLTCGSVSGRDTDKAKLTGLHPEALDAGTVTFAEAKFALLCETAYKQDIDPNCIVDKTVNDNYDDDYHRMYIATIKKAFVRES